VVRTFTGTYVEPSLSGDGIHIIGRAPNSLFAGPVVTAGGLLFAGTRDRTVRAFDVETGKALWQKDVDAAMEGIPAVYEAGGRQFIVFCASAQVGLTPATQVKISGGYVAFALPAAR
jgi:quinoprotein glucose dehydrogenase